MKLAILLTILWPTLTFAELIQVPENCLEKSITPCLVRASQQEVVSSADKKFQYLFGSKSITKWTQFGSQPEVELLEGHLHSKVISAAAHLTLNGIKPNSSSFFALRQKQKLRILDGEKFIHSEYLLSASAEVGNVISKVEFLDKRNLVSFLAHFFPTKTQLLHFLKKNESAWAKQFALQNANQTKVLKRAIASVENKEKDDLLRQQLEQQEAKKVRQTFFYRTFYR